MLKKLKMPMLLTWTPWLKPMSTLQMSSTPRLPSGRKARVTGLKEY